VDSEVARTLAELERKLQDLERALGAVGERAPGAGLEPNDRSQSTARLVDERLEGASANPPSPPPQPPSAPAPQPDSDESIDLVELARFRDHLERTMSELLTDYERVIRLRSAAEPRPPVE
jgi:hypothetical protein